MLLCLAAALLLTSGQMPVKKNLGGVDLTELPVRVPGYRTLQVAGFTVLADPRVIEPPEKQTISPLQVLEGELKILGRLVHTQALAELRKLVIWAEWDEVQPLGNGREGNALAVYYGGSQRGMLQSGRNPLKANNISILSMRNLTREHQPGQQSDRCVLLHEVVHAVHHTILGFNNPQIEAAYLQALERGKLERGSYAATSAAEFFAEMSCAYLDRLQYFPRDRDELRQHDPVTFQLLARLWSGAENAASRTPKVAISTREDLPKVAMSLGDFQAGELASGPPTPSARALMGRVVVVLFFAAKSADDLQALARSAELQRELAEHGLSVLASHASTSADRAEVRRAAAQRAPALSVTLVPRLARNPGLGKLPHTVVFDSLGQARFSGSPYDAELVARQLVGDLTADAAARDTDDEAGDERPPAPFLAIDKALRQGDKPPAVLARLEKLTPADPVSRAWKTRLVEAILAGPHQSLKDSQAGPDKAVAFCDLEGMDQRWRGTSFAAEIARALTTLRNDPEVQRELRARILQERVRAYDAQLSRRPKSFEPSKPAFRTANADLLAPLNQALERLRQEYAGTPALAGAERLAAKYQPE